MIETHNKELLELQKKYRKGQIKEEDLSKEEIYSLEELYKIRICYIRHCN